MNMQPFKAMLFAAGLGTRLKPFTEHHPKALAVVNDKTLLERNIAYLNSFGINVRGRVGHFCQLVGSFLRNVRRGCGRNSDALFGVEDPRKCRLQF